MLSQVNHDIHFDEDYGDSPREKKNREKKSKQVMKTIQTELDLDRENMTEKERRIMKEVKSSIFSVASSDDISDTIMSDSTSNNSTNTNDKKSEEDVLVYTVGLNEFDSELSDHDHSPQSTPATTPIQQVEETFPATQIVEENLTETSMEDSLLEPDP
jgi:hypothetical protein